MNVGLVGIFSLLTDAIGPQDYGYEAYQGLAQNRLAKDGPTIAASGNKISEYYSSTTQYLLIKSPHCDTSSVI